LKYRLARAKDSTYTIEGNELEDIQRAIRLVRSRATQWQLDPERIGVMGFSAGGEVAALASTKYDAGNAGAADPIERISSRPAFEALIYPGIPKQMVLTKQTPPAFLVCGNRIDRVSRKAFRSFTSRSKGQAFPQNFTCTLAWGMALGCGRRIGLPSPAGCSFFSTGSPPNKSALPSREGRKVAGYGFASRTASYSRTTWTSLRFATWPLAGNAGASAFGQIDRRILPQREDFQFQLVPGCSRNPVQPNQPGGGVIKIVRHQLPIRVQSSDVTFVVEFEENARRNSRG